MGSFSAACYGSSTGFFGKAMFNNGPQYLSAAVLYENMVAESYDPKYQLPFPIVAIYPREGTFWSDHPVGVVEKPWVSAEHREAAAVYINWLLETQQQQRALQFGFRPSDVKMPLQAPIDAAHGLDPQEPRTILELPSTTVMDGINRLWLKCKKHSDVVIVFDRSGSMAQQGRMANAKAGALTALELLHDEDLLSLLWFSNGVDWAGKRMLLAKQRNEARKAIDALFPQGGTCLFDSVIEAYEYLVKNPRPDRISAVIVLTDGQDTGSKARFEQLLQVVRFDPEKENVRVFTIGYGSEANKVQLKRVAEETRAKFFEGTPENIREVFKEISTFF